MADYDRFAEDYEWLFDDDDLTGGPFLAAYEDVLDGLSTGARVADVACGIGVEAVALARRGFEVVASDVSEGMAARTAAAAARAGVEIAVETCPWEDLPRRGLGTFDLVLCNGNSLVHADGAAERRRALRAMRSLLRDGGRVVVGTRDFEVLRSARPTVEVAPRPVRRGGTTCVAFYTWSIPPGWDETHVATVNLALVRGEGIEHRHHDVAFVPYRNEELELDIAAAGLEVVRTSCDGVAPRYTLVLAATR